MTDRELMQQALEALTAFREWEMGQDYHSNRETILSRAFDAEERLTAALAKPDAVINGMPAYEGPLSKAQRTEPEQAHGIGEKE